MFALGPRNTALLACRCCVAFVRSSKSALTSPLRRFSILIGCSVSIRFVVTEPEPRSAGEGEGGSDSRKFVTSLSCAEFEFSDSVEGFAFIFLVVTGATFDLLKPPMLPLDRFFCAKNCWPTLLLPLLLLLPPCNELRWPALFLFPCIDDRPVRFSFPVSSSSAMVFVPPWRDTRWPVP